MKSSRKSTLEVWGGTGLAVGAALMMRYAAASGFRTLAFATAVLGATWLIIRSIGHSRRWDDE